MQSSAPIVVASAVDAGYLPLIEVVATSISASARSGRPVRYHVFYDGPESPTTRRLAAWQRGPVTVHFHSVTSPWRHFDIGRVSGLPPSTLMRLSLPDWLPDTARVIYLDADLIVETDLGELYDAPLDGMAVSATLDLPLRDHVRRDPSPKSWIRHYMTQILGFRSEADQEDYRQSGVLLMDLEILRRTGFVQAATAVLRLKEKQIWMGDQCIINIVLRGRMAMMDQRWNTTPYSLEHADPGSNAPGILHFAQTKPWRDGKVAGGDRWWRMAREAGRERHFRRALLSYRILRLLGHHRRPKTA